MVVGEWDEEGEVGIDGQLDNHCAMWRSANELVKKDSIYSVLATDTETGTDA